MLHSISSIIKQYNTGEQPVLATCSDGHDYVCKYPLSSASAYKLACELAGNELAKAWELNSPETAIIKISAKHQSGIKSSSIFERVCIGSRLLPNAIDITPISAKAVAATENSLIDLLTISLFDLWVANEDRNFNNYNLLYDLNQCRLVPIDFGCIFNSSTFDFPLSQLTLSDSLIYSELFTNMAESYKYIKEFDFINNFKGIYLDKAEASKPRIQHIVNSIPQEWNISSQRVKAKLGELFSEMWIENVWENFIDILLTSTSQKQ